MELSQNHSIGATLVSLVSLFVFNMILMAIFNFLTIDSFANINSRVGALLLSVLIPLCIVYKTRKMPALERLLKYGFGFMADIILMIIIAGFPEGFTTGLIPCLIIALGVLYYGAKWFSIEA
jgi:hypothetical protein